MARKRVSRKRTSRKKRVSKRRTSRKRVSRKKSKRKSRRRRVSRRNLKGGFNTFIERVNNFSDCNSKTKCQERIDKLKKDFQEDGQMSTNRGKEFDFLMKKLKQYD